MFSASAVTKALLETAAPALATTDEPASMTETDDTFDDSAATETLVAMGTEYNLDKRVSAIQSRLKDLEKQKPEMVASTPAPSAPAVTDDLAPPTTEGLGAALKALFAKKKKKNTGKEKDGTSDSAGSWQEYDKEVAKYNQSRKSTASATAEYNFTLNDFQDELDFYSELDKKDASSSTLHRHETSATQKRDDFNDELEYFSRSYKPSATQEPQTEGFLRGLRDKIAGAQTLHPLSKFSGPIAVPLVTTINGAGITSDNLPLRLSEKRTTGVLRAIEVRIAKSGRSLKTSVAPIIVSGFADGITGRIYSGLQKYGIMREHFFSAKNGVMSPARVDVSLPDPVSGESLKLVFRASEKHVEQLNSERAWATSHGKDHVIVFRFGADKQATLEDVIMFYRTAASVSASAADVQLLGSEKAFARAIVSMASNATDDKALEPTSLGYPLAGVTAYPAHVAVSTMLTQHAVETGAVTKAVTSAKGTVFTEASAQQRAVFNEFVHDVSTHAHEAQRANLMDSVTAAQARGAQIYPFLRDEAHKYGVTDAALARALTQAYQGVHSMATRAPTQDSARLLNKLAMHSNITNARVSDIVETYFV